MKTPNHYTFDGVGGIPIIYRQDKVIDSFGKVIGLHIEVIFLSYNYGLYSSLLSELYTSANNIGLPHNQLRQKEDSVFDS